MIKILAISGSLRQGSSNTALLQAAATLSPPSVEIVLYQDIGKLPFFTPDLVDNEPAIVKDFHSQLQICDGVMIASPEYAHGVTGVLKNALDWGIGMSSLINKPVSLLNASAKARHAQEALREILTMMHAHIVKEASLTIPLPANNIGMSGILAHPELSKLVHQAIQELVCAIKVAPKPIATEL